MVQELEHYHPDGVEIIGAFVRGINAYIDLCGFRRVQTAWLVAWRIDR